MTTLYCISCNIHYTGIAREDMPCAYCLTPIVDIEKQLAILAEQYDPIHWLVDGARCV